jgi:hypothetical protein
MINREEIIQYIKKHSQEHDEKDLSKHSDEQLIILKLSVDFERKRKDISDMDGKGIKG